MTANQTPAIDQLRSLESVEAKAIIAYYDEAGRMTLEWNNADATIGNETARGMALTHFAEVRRVLGALATKIVRDMGKAK